MDEQSRVSLEPDKDLAFVYGHMSMSAILKIYVSEKVSRGYHFLFQIRASNKSDYKVSEPSGSIRKSPHIIYFYLKNKNKITKNLRDKFLITITDKQTGDKILSQKLNVIIESATPSKRDLNILEGSSFNTTKFASAYTSPVNNTRSSMFVSTIMDPNKSQARMLQNLKGGGVRSVQKTLKQKEQNLKVQLSDSIRQVDRKKRRIVQLERQNRNKKARARFSMYFTFFLAIFFFLLGWASNKLQIKQKINQQYLYIKSKLSDISQLSL